MSSNLPKPLLCVELLLLCVAMPLTFVYLIPPKHLFAVLWCVALYGVVILHRYYGLRLGKIWNASAVHWANLRPMLLRFLLAALLLGACTAIFEPGRFLNLPLERTSLWIVIMFLYPILSVFPQEMIFRAFFHARYAPVFHTQRLMLMASAVAFGFAHVLFQNWVAVLLCTAGGFIFGMTYERTKSLALVWIEHALYGCFIFTIGLGSYFYHGTAQVAHEVEQEVEHLAK